MLLRSTVDGAQRGRRGMAAWYRTIAASVRDARPCRRRRRKQGGRWHLCSPTLNIAVDRLTVAARQVGTRISTWFGGEGMLTLVLKDVRSCQSLLLLVRVECRRYALELEPNTRSTWPRPVVQSAIAPDLTLPAAIAGAHHLEALVTVVFVDKDILLCVGRLGRRQNGRLHQISGHGAAARCRDPQSLRCVVGATRPGFQKVSLARTSAEF